MRHGILVSVFIPIQSPSELALLVMLLAMRTLVESWVLVHSFAKVRANLK
jgi:hypothetical protein